MDPSERTARVSRDIKAHCCRESRPLRTDYILPIVRYWSRSIECPITRCLLLASISDLSPVTCKSPSHPILCLRRPFALSVCLEARNIAGFVPTAHSRMRASFRAIGRRTRARARALCAHGRQTSEFCANTSVSSPAVEIRKRDFTVVAYHEDNASTYRCYLARP